MRGTVVSAPTIIEFVTDPQLLGLAVSPAQRTLLKAIYGLGLDGEETDLWHLCTGRATYPGTPFAEATVIAGGRAGKDSRIAAPTVLFEAFFGGHEGHLAKGERGVVPLVAQDQRATAIAFGYVKDYATRSPLLASMVDDVLASEIVLKNRLRVACFPSTLRSLRGWSIPVAVLDEVAFYRLEGQADSDVEIQASVRRGMIGFSSATRLIKISTPYLGAGLLYADFERGWGKDDPDLLVWRAPTALMNPTITPERLERERRLDPERFQREYEAEFSADLQAFLPAEIVKAAVMPERRELPPVLGVRYFAAVDPSGGGADAFTFSVAHIDGDRVVQDVLRVWGKAKGKPPELAAVVAEIADLLGRYGLREVIGDRYAGEWVSQAFREKSITYRAAAVNKSEAYLALEPVLIAGQAELLDDPTLARELMNLERKHHPGGRTSVDHPTGRHDDRANVTALAIFLAAQHLRRERIRPRTVAEEEAARPEGQIERFQRERHEWESTKTPALLALIRSKAPAPVAAKIEAAVEKMLKEHTPEDAIYRQVRDAFYELLGWRRLMDTGIMDEWDAEDRLNRMLNEGEAA